MRREPEAHETTMKMAITPHLAPPSKQHVGIWATAIQNDVQGRS